MLDLRTQTEWICEIAREVRESGEDIRTEALQLRQKAKAIYNRCIETRRKSERVRQQARNVRQ